MELLVLLVERRGELVTHDQIVERIWGKDVFLDTDNSIRAAVRKIRQVLRDDPERPRFVVTVTGKGYRFVAPVEEGSPPTLAPGPETKTQSDDGLLGKKVSHYRVLQMLGGGGMGVVYKAEDLKLGRPVALKFLPSELASDPIAFERLQREARAASSLDHPNICSIYQLGEHDGQAFIVMQMLEGQTLREWIEASTQKPADQRVKEMVDLAIQIADGLEAAHQKGIIHRDIKPTNIFITSRGQAKILDFGVAKFVDAVEVGEIKLTGAALAVGGPDPHLTHTGAAVGTPSYLAPEQILRNKIDARADLFSFGLVLYEMATGQRAFSGNTATAIRDAVLNLPPVPARQLNPELPTELERVISRCLEKDPSNRYQSASELRADLIKLSERKQVASWSPARIAFATAAALLAIVALLLIADVGGVRMQLLSRKTPVDSPATFKARPSVAVLGFQSLSGKADAAWISTALAELLSAELAAGQQLRVVPSEDVAHMKVDLSLPVAETYGKETLDKIRRHLSTEMVVVGSYLASGKGAGGRIRVNLQLQDATSGNTVGLVTRDGAESDLVALVSEAGANLREELGIGDLAAADIKQVHAALPASTEAARLYSEGLTKLQNFDPLRARELLERAVAADPNHALSHSALAQAWQALGYDAKARAEAKRAFDLSEHLSRENRLAVEARHRELSQDFPAAIDLYQTLYNFFPDRIDYGLRLASAQLRADQRKESLATITRIRKSAVPGASDGAIDLAEARAHQGLSNFAEEQRAAAVAAAKGRIQAAPLLVAAARLREGLAWNHMGDNEKATLALTEARDLSQRGNPNTAVWADLYLGHVLYDQGKFDAARQSYQKALEGARTTGDQAAAESAVEGIGNVFFEQGKLQDAKRSYEEVLRISREIELKSGIAAALSGLANLFEVMGDLDGAAKMNEQTLQVYREIGSKRMEGTALGNWGIVLVGQGKLALAKSKIEEALVLQQQIGYKRGTGFSLATLADIARLEDRLEDARKTVNQAIAVRKETGDESNTARSQLQLAQIAIDQDRPDEAASLARSTAEVFHRLNSPNDEAGSYGILARALLAQSNSKDAHAAAEQAASLARKSDDRSARFSVNLAVAEVNAHTGRASAAMRGFQSVLEEASRYGYIGVALEARMGLAQLELRSANKAAGFAPLQQLHDDARRQGHYLIARKAAAALNGPGRS